MSEIRVNRMSSLEINLLQQEETSADRVPVIRPLLLAAVFVLGTGALGWFWHGISEDKVRLEDNLAGLNKKITTLQDNAVEQKASEGSGSPLSIEQWLETPDFLRPSSPKPAVVLTRLNEIFPQEANLTSFSLAQDGKVEAAGSFADLEKVITFMQEVRHSSDFTLVRMVRMDKRIASGQEAAATESGPVSDQQSAEQTTGGTAPDQNGQETVQEAQSVQDSLPLIDAKFELVYHSAAGTGQGGAEQ
jgi:hypothetical protein